MARGPRVELRQPLQRVAQARQVARPCRTQRDARGDALDVDACPATMRAQRDAGLHRRSARSTASSRALTALSRSVQRMVQRVAQQPAAHAGRAGIEQREQRRRGVAAQGLGELEVAPRRRVHAHEGALLLDHERLDVRDGRALRGARIFEQRAGRGDGDRQFDRAEPREIRRLELAAQIARAPRRDRIATAAGACTAASPLIASRRSPSSAIRISDGRSRSSSWPRLASAVSVTAKRPEASDSHASPARRACGLNRKQQVVALFLEQRRVRERAGRHDARDLALDRAFRLCGSPICSQIATDSPSFTSFARYCSTAW